jgi:TM2 domain-containing membrane protein YozV
MGQELTPAQLQEAKSKKMTAGICALIVGSFGVHKFILGNTTPGVIMLCATVLPCFMGGLVMGPIAIVEGILYLTKSDEEFYQTYMVDKKAWF